MMMNSSRPKSGIIVLICALSILSSIFGKEGSGYGFESSDGTYVMYDISTDPYENTDVSENADYSTYIPLLEGRKDYWQALTVDVNAPDATAQTSTWKSCGRICPWLTSEEEVPTIEQKYEVDDVPHIVYVLVDDWGYNDLGSKSTYLSWTTPTIDRLAEEGILLDSYYTNEVCAPSRASLMTGRYALRTGVYTNTAELPLTETTLAEELKSAGYRNYAIGKWHLGQSTTQQFPLQRGFDYFYGFVNGKSTYYDKKYGNYVDLWENNDYVTDSTALDDSYHSAYLFQSKAEEAIAYHASNYADTPMFLYYAMQLVHDPWTAPAEYLSRCTDEDSQVNTLNGDSSSTSVSMNNYCAFNVMMDEAIANLTCALTSYGFADNTVLIIAGDNGGESSISGSSYPFKGHKGSVLRGGVSNHAIVHSNILPSSSRGSTYSYNVHITDWLPTLMNLATANTWEGSYSGNDIDGVDIWDAMINNEASSRTEMVFSSYDDSIALQYGDIKYIYNFDQAIVDDPKYVYDEDLDPDASRMTCDDASLISSSSLHHLMKSAYHTVFRSSSSSTMSVMLSSFFLFVLVAGVAITTFTLIIGFRRQKLASSRSSSSSSSGVDDMDLYSTYKEEADVDMSETRTLL